MAITKRKATHKDAERFIADSFTDRIAFTAARVLLVRATEDAAFASLDPELQAAIDRFLDKHGMR